MKFTHTAIKAIAGEFFGTAILGAVVIGSGIMATKMSSDAGVQLLMNDLSTIFALGVLIWIFSSVSGAHFNPIVTLISMFQRSLSAATGFFYILAQCLGGFIGAVVANIMYKLPAINTSHHVRHGAGVFVGEVVATAGLVFIIEVLGKRGEGRFAPIAIPLWIGSAYIFTSSTSFANPAVTFGRIFSDTFAGIAAQSVAMFVVAQLVGGVLGTLAGNYFSLPASNSK